MSISNAVKQTVRRRARCACEYCGVSETSAGGELTVDQFRPQSKGGVDEIENLVYCCVRCNLYKGDFWGESEGVALLWNPRVEPFSNHFWTAGSGQLFALTEKGELTLQALNLNRSQLIEYRRQKFIVTEIRRFVETDETSVVVLLEQNERLLELVRAQRRLLDEQQKLLDLMLRKNEK